MKKCATKAVAAVLALLLLPVAGGCAKEPATSGSSEAPVSDVSTLPVGDATASSTGKDTDKTAGSSTRKPTANGHSDKTTTSTGGVTTDKKTEASGITQTTTTTTTTTTKNKTTTKTFPKVNYPVTPSMTVQQAAEKLTNKECRPGYIDYDFVRVTDYNPDYAFTHQQGMAVFKGKLYVIFSRGQTNEDYPGQEMVVSSSSNFYVWSEPKVIAPSRQGTYGKTTIITGCLYSTEDRLYAYCAEHNWGAGKFNADGSFNPNGTNEGYSSRVLMTFTEDGVNWSEPIHMGFTAHESPRQTLTGEWLASYGAGMLYSSEKNPSGLYWERVGLTTAQINRAKQQYGATMLGECSWYQTDDYVINMVMRSDVVRGGRQVFEAFLAQSYDGGKTWTDAYPAHNFRLDWQMLHMGRLPDDKGYYFVGTTHPDSNPKLSLYDRYPLYLMVSKDGYNFNKGYVLRNEVYNLRQPGHAKGGQYGYPEVLFHDGYMYVVCSRMKELIEVTRVKLSDIEV